MNDTLEILREPRTLLSGRLRYTDEAGEEGRARWIDLSRDGAAIELGRYLRPGRHITLRFSAPLTARAQYALRAQVIWCKPAKTASEFVAGLHLLRDTPEDALALSALRHWAQRTAGTAEPAYWPGFAVTPEAALISLLDVI